MSNIIHLNEAELKNQLGELVRETVEETVLSIIFRTFELAPTEQP